MSGAWNYRIIRDFYEYSDPTLGREYFLNIYEVYYNTEEDCVGNITCKCPIKYISSEPATLSGSDLDELKSDFELMRQAFEKEILEYSEVVALFKKDEMLDEEFDEENS